jgi:hypothetical protein
VTDAYKTVDTYICTLTAGAWAQTPSRDPDFLCMSVEEAIHSLRVQGNALVTVADVLPVRRALGVVPEGEGVRE